MDTSTGIAVIGLGVTLLGGIVSAVWAVSQIRTQTAVLKGMVEQQTHAITRVTETLDKLDDRTDQHEGRIIRLEERVSA